MKTIYPKISIVTPNLNGVKFLEETMRSVVSQNYPNLEYIVIDGGSTDGSVEIIRKHEAHIAYWETKPDQGLYHALRKGFEKCTGEIMGWINSDDILTRNSLFSIAEIFSYNPQIKWIQGYPTVIDDQSRMVYQRPPVSSKLCFYLKDYRDGRFIQQESTFWTRSLWDQAGGFISQDYRFAGDFELWIRFFNFAQLFTTSAVLGSFRTRNDGQLSVMNYQNYIAECDQIIDMYIKQLSPKELKDLRRIRQLRKIQTSLPPISLFPGFNNHLLKLLKSPGQVNFNFHTYSYRLED